MSCVHIAPPAAVYFVRMEPSGPAPGPGGLAYIARMYTFSSSSTHITELESLLGVLNLLDQSKVCPVRAVSAAMNTRRIAYFFIAGTLDLCHATYDPCQRHAK